MLRLPSSWVWDFWIADDGDRYHLFFLKASRALLDPDRRHWRATVGHATSTDLRTWTEHADALLPDDAPSVDDLATWTGSVVREDGGRWRMFYTAVNRADGGLAQRISSVVSDDLFREPPEPLLEPGAVEAELIVLASDAPTVFTKRLGLFHGLPLPEYQ